MSTDWRTDELVAERDAGRVQVRAWDNEIARLERLLAAARAAWGQMNDRVHELTSAQVDLKAGVAARGTVSDADGRPRSGPTALEQGYYDTLGTERMEAEKSYQRWVDERRTRPAGDDRAWSPRCPSDVERSLAEARRARSFAGAGLAAVEGELAALEAAEEPPGAAEEPPGALERLRSWIA